MTGGQRCLNQTGRERGGEGRGVEREKKTKRREGEGGGGRKKREGWSEGATHGGANEGCYSGQHYIVKL